MKKRKNRIYVIGAGFAGASIAADIRKKGILGKVVAFLDDDPAKIGTRIDGTPVFGPIDDVVELLESTPADEALIAMPGCPQDRLKSIYLLLVRAGFVSIRIVPTVAQIVEGGAHLIQARNIDPEDLLARTPVTINLRESLAYLRGKRVLITGAGGSIGGELGRQLLSGGAERLYLFGHGENSIYDIDRELRTLQAEGVGERATIVPIIGELQDPDYMDFLLERLHADVVFHTAAHKHVPMMEANPVEAVKNNVFGTANLLNACRRNDVERFVMISTDKVVEPTSVYGASKRIAEALVLSQPTDRGAFIVVRFGNVLGSRGSIIPLFRKQILSGGPVTLTHPSTSRYFMTIPEATSLVLQAGGVGEAGRLYVLDMGSPLRIRDLAEQMIRFYGFEPETDIYFDFIGMRPGEKITEELYDPTEKPRPTDYPRINRAEGNQGLVDRVHEVVDQLRDYCFRNPEHISKFRNRKEMRRVLHRYMPAIEVKDNEPEY